jgi:hypothetical protein
MVRILSKITQEVITKLMILHSDQIEQLTPERLDLLAQLDEAGLFLEPAETFEMFYERLKRLRHSFADINDQLDSETGFAPFYDLKFSRNDLISDEVMDEAAEISNTLYAFKINWVPGFFLSTNLGMLWGGCAISVPEEDFSLFLIRKSFRSRKKWFIYRRDELLAHELCHIARAPLHDYRFEEHFAYQTSFSRLRRYMGNCFIYRYDAIWFLLPVLFLLAIQILITAGLINLPIMPFWFMAGTYPLWLFIRNQRSRNILHRAKRKLARICNYPNAVLFRCTATEIAEFANAPTDNLIKELWLRNCENELRWRVIDYRFNSESQDSIAETAEQAELTKF